MSGGGRCNCGCAVSVYDGRGCVYTCARMPAHRARAASLKKKKKKKAVAFCTLIEIISMRIEPSQLTSVLCDYPCVSPDSTSPSAFTFPGLFSNNRERLFGCNMKERVQIVERACCST